MYQTGFAEKLPVPLQCFCQLCLSLACFPSDNPRRLVSAVPVIICISRNFSPGIKTQLARRFLNGAGAARFCAPARSLRSGNQKSRVAQGLCKEPARSRSGRQLRGQHTGVDGRC